MTEATFVFRHSDESEARRFCKELVALYPFMGGGDTQIIAMATGDAMSVSDAVRMALMCNALDADYERTEFALAMCDCNNWDDCMRLAEKWDLRHDQGEFLDASDDTHPQGEDATQIEASAPLSGAVGDSRDAQ